MRHMSPRTETAYVGWIRQFIIFHGRRHPDGMGEAEITHFLSHLATERHVSASTQNQALAVAFPGSSALRRSADWGAPPPSLARVRHPARGPQSGHRHGDHQTR
jgi:hypothetical protein